MTSDLLLPGESDQQRALQAPVERAANRNPVVSYLASLGSKNSRRVQKTALDRVAEALSGGKIQDCRFFPWEQLDYGMVTAIKAWLDDQYAPATVNRYLCAVRRVLKEAWRHHLISAEAYQRATDVQSVSAHRLPTGRELDNDEIRALLEACLGDETNPTLGVRDAAIISLMYSSGLRRAEVVTLDLADVDPGSGSLRVIGKRNKERIAFLAAGARLALEKWLEKRGKLPGPLFYSVNKGGNIVRTRKERLNAQQKQAGERAKRIPARLSDQTIYHLFEKRALEAGLLQKATPHDMRRTFVSDLLSEGVDLATVSKMAGHEDANTTRRYDRRPAKVMREAAEKLNVPYPTD
jgi:site-specific recombinase XerD